MAEDQANTTSRHAKCPKCDAPLSKASECSNCGGKSTYSVALEGWAIEAKISSIGTVNEQRSADGTSRRVDHRPASGGRSLSETTAEGSYQAQLSGDMPRGIDGEPHVLKVLLAAMETGRRVKVLPKNEGDDAGGKDARFEINGEEFSVQVVTMPAEPELWEKLSVTGNVQRDGDLIDAVEMVRAAIEKKRHGWKGCVLALDATTVGALPGGDLVDAYVLLHGDPNKEFGFAETWIVGPTVGSTIKIG